MNYNQNSKKLLVDLINKVNGYELTVDDVNFSAPISLPAGSPRNTQVTVTGTGTLNFTGPKDIQYDRLDLGELFEVVDKDLLDNPDAYTNVSHILAIINQRFNLQLDNEDIHLSSINRGTGDYPIQVEIKARDTSLVYKGSVFWRLTNTVIGGPTAPFVEFNASVGEMFLDQTTGRIRSILRFNEGFAKISNNLWEISMKPHPRVPSTPMSDERQIDPDADGVYTVDFKHVRRTYGDWTLDACFGTKDNTALLDKVKIRFSIQSLSNPSVPISYFDLVDMARYPGDLVFVKVGGNSETDNIPASITNSEESLAIYTLASATRLAPFLPGVSTNNVGALIGNYRFTLTVRDAANNSLFGNFQIDVNIPSTPEVVSLTVTQDNTYDIDPGDGWGVTAVAPDGKVVLGGNPAEQYFYLVDPATSTVTLSVKPKNGVGVFWSEHFQSFLYFSDTTSLAEGGYGTVLYRWDHVTDTYTQIGAYPNLNFTCRGIHTVEAGGKLYVLIMSAGEVSLFFINLDTMQVDPNFTVMYAPDARMFTDGEYILLLRDSGLGQVDLGRFLAGDPLPDGFAYHMSIPGTIVGQGNACYNRSIDRIAVATSDGFFHVDHRASTFESIATGSQGLSSSSQGLIYIDDLDVYLAVSAGNTDELRWTPADAINWQIGTRLNDGGTSGANGAVVYSSPTAKVVSYGQLAIGEFEVISG